MRALAWPLMGVVLLYRYGLSPLFGRPCRFQPTCSEYTLEALHRHGAWHGSRFALRRLSRCHPWGGAGYDPVPPVRPTRSD